MVAAVGSEEGGVKNCLLNRWSSILFAAALLACAPSHAAFTCTGQISRLSVNTAGSVYVSIGYGTWAICGLSAPFGEVAAETCRAWYAALLAAQRAGESVQFYFNTGSGCTAVGDWVVVTPNLYHMDLSG
jgi:hypothetical protein